MVSKEEMLEAIYKEIWPTEFARYRDDDLEDWRKVEFVMFGDIIHHLWIVREWFLSLDWYNTITEKLKYLFLLYWDKRKPIQEQSDTCIKYVYSLIQSER